MFYLSGKVRAAAGKVRAGIGWVILIRTQIFYYYIQSAISEESNAGGWDKYYKPDPWSGCQPDELRPASLAWYRARSAACSTPALVAPWMGKQATPVETVIWTACLPFLSCKAAIAMRNCSARWRLRPVGY